MGGSQIISVKHMSGSGQSLPLAPKCVSLAIDFSHSVANEQLALAISYPPTIFGPQKEVWPGVSKLQSREVGRSVGAVVAGKAVVGWDVDTLIGIIGMVGESVVIVRLLLLVVVVVVIVVKVDGTADDDDDDDAIDGESDRVGGNVSPSQ